ALPSRNLPPPGSSYRSFVFPPIPPPLPTGFVLSLLALPYRTLPPPGSFNRSLLFPPAP
ncbi:predicted protein, partial [Nematostella vectensis]